jgi:two-component system, LytTR family, response regulator
VIERRVGPPRAATVLVVDDEPLARRGLRRLLGGRDDLDVVGECEDGAAAVEFIERHHPDVVLLDVQMPGVDGLEVLRRVGPERMPAVVFVTAFDEFAIQAFDLAAVDYVVKPFTDDRLLRAVGRALTRHVEHVAARSLGRLFDALAHELPAAHPAAYTAAHAAPAPPRAAAPAGFRARFLVAIGPRDAVIHASEVQRIQANGYYATLVTHDRKEYLVRTPLDQLERELDPALFIRVHRSSIVSLGEVRGTERTAGRGTAVVLRDGSRVPVSRSRREAVFHVLGAVSPGAAAGRDALR